MVGLVEYNAGGGGCASGKRDHRASGVNNRDKGLTSEDTTPTGVVRLLQVTKIPAWYGKLVRARVDGEIEGKLLLITPKTLEKCVELADVLVEVGDGPCETLVLKNHWRETLTLERGMEIGSVVAMKVRSGEVPMAIEESGAEDLEMASVLNVIAFGDSVKGRAEQLLPQLNLQFDHLTSVIRSSWRSFFSRTKMSLHCIRVNWGQPKLCLTPSTREPTLPSSTQYGEFPLLSGARWMNW